MSKCTFYLATKLRPTSSALKQARDCGFNAAELWTNAEILKRNEEIESVCQQSPMRYVIHFPNKPNLAAGDLERVARLYRQLKCQAMVIHEPMFHRYGESLLALDPDLRLGIENHRLDEAGFTAWAENSRWLTLDVEHLWLFTLSGGPLNLLEDALTRFLNRYGHKLVHIHLPGCLPGHEEHRPMYCNRDMVMMVWDRLHQARFSGLVVSEVNLEYQNACDLRMDVLLFRRWAQLRGQPISDTAEMSANG